LDVAFFGRSDGLIGRGEIAVVKRRRNEVEKSEKGVRDQIQKEESSSSH